MRQATENIPFASMYQLSKSAIYVSYYQDKTSTMCAVLLDEPISAKARGPRMKPGKADTGSQLLLQGEGQGGGVANPHINYATTAILAVGMCETP